MLKGNSHKRWLLRLAVAVVGLAIALLAGHWVAVLERPPDRHTVAAQLLAEGRADQAAHVFESPLWQGVAHYQAGRLRRSLAAFAERPGVMSDYNMAGALARMERYDEAIELYRHALELEPAHADARFNLALVRAALKVQEQQREDQQTASAVPQQAEHNQRPRERDSSKAITQTVKDNAATPQRQTGNERREAEDETDQKKAARAAGEFEGGDTNMDIPPASRYATAGGTMQNPRDEVIENIEGKAEGAAKLESDEHEIAEQITLRQIRDDPALVLRARLLAIHRNREGLSK